MTGFKNLEGLSADDIARLASVSQNLLTNPKTRKDAQKLVKQIDETASFPELDIDERIRKQQEEFDAKLADRDKKAADERAAASRRDSLKEAGLLVGEEAVTIVPGKAETDPALAPLEQFMIQHKIGDYQAGARLFKMSQEQNAPAPTNFAGMPTPPELPKIEMGNDGNINNWARRTAYETAADIKTGKRRFNEQGVEVTR